MKLMRLAVILSLMFLVTNCASIIDGSNQVVSVNSNVQGADVYINGILVGKTPFSGQVKNKNNTQVRIEKKGVYHTNDYIEHFTSSFLLGQCH